MNVSDVEKVASDLTDHRAQALGKYGPRAWEMACSIVRVESITERAYGAVGVAGLIWLFSIYRGIEAKRGPFDLDEGHWCFFTLAGGTAGLFFLLTVLFDLGDMWNWIGAFAPDLSIVHSIVDKALKP